MSVLFALVAILAKGWWQVALFAAAILYFAMQIKSENAAQLFHQTCSEAIKDETIRVYYALTEDELSEQEEGRKLLEERIQTGLRAYTRVGPCDAFVDARYFGFAVVHVLRRGTARWVRKDRVTRDILETLEEAGVTVWKVFVRVY